MVEVKSQVSPLAARRSWGPSWRRVGVPCGVAEGVRGPVALRPRLSLGVPLSRDGAADLGSGSLAVKHF